MRVSVVIPVFNTERFVEQAVRSALAQPQTAEVLVVDDGSTDSSRARCDGLAAEDPRVRVLEHAGRVNRGGCASRNLGIDHAQSEFVSFLDADDYYLPARFATAERLFADATIDGVYEACANHYENESMRKWWLANYTSGEVTTLRGVVAPEDLLEVLLRGDRGRFQTNGIVVRRDFFQRCGRFAPEMRRHGDSLLWLKMAAAGKLVGGSIEAPVAMRRLHGANSIMTVTDPALRLLIWPRLLRWMRRRGVSATVVELIAVRYFIDWKAARLGSSPPGEHRLRTARFLLSVGVHHPRLVRTGPFRELVKDLVRSA